MGTHIKIENSKPLSAWSRGRLQISAVTLLLNTQRVATDEYTIFISMTGDIGTVDLTDLRLKVTNKVD